jgi:UDP-glucose-4-epimerase GalE
MRDAGVNRLVISSTAAVYGIPDSVPIPETAHLSPINPYGETKRAFETAAAWYGAAYGLRSVSLRYFNVAGASDRNGESHNPETHLIPNILTAAAGGPPVSLFGDDYPTPDGTCLRDYIHVADLADAHVLALQAIVETSRSQFYNLGTGHPHSVREVIDTVERVTRRTVPWTLAPRRPGDPAVLFASNQKAKTELHWTPRFPDLESIVRTACAWHHEHPHGFGARQR